MTPPPWPSIPALLASSEERFADQVAIRDGDVSLTYPELAAAARQFAGALVESGVEPGDRVSIWCFNCVEWVVAVLGIFSAGAVLVPINTRFKGAEAADMLARGEVRALVTVTDFLDTDYVAMLEATGAELPALETVIVARGAARGDAVGWADFLGRATPGLAGRGGPAQRRARPGRPLGHPVHVGHDGRAQGRRDDARPDPHGGHATGWP